MSLRLFVTLACLLSALPALAAERIVSLYVGHSENLVALGASSHLVALSTSDDKELLPQLPRLSMKSSPEAILALKPDLVLLRPMNEQSNPVLVTTLRSLGVAVASIDPPAWDDFETYLEQLADLVGLNGAQAAQKARSLKDDLASQALTARGDRPAPQVFLEATSKELHSCSPRSWAARLMESLGAVNVAAGAEPLRSGSALAPFGAERLLEASRNGLDWYLLQRGAMNRRSEDELRAQSWFASLGNVKILVIPEGWISRPSLLGLERGATFLIEHWYGSPRASEGSRKK